jgi:hypothetical protein
MRLASVSDASGATAGGERGAGGVMSLLKLHNNKHRQTEPNVV